MASVYFTCHAMFKATADNRGTLQQLAQELEDVHADSMSLKSVPWIMMH